MIARVAAFIYTLALLVVLTVPGQDLPDVALSADKLSHAAAFALLTGLWLAAGSRFGYQTAWVIYGCLGFAVASEIYQGFLPWRYGDVFDAAANTFGVLAAAALLALIGRLRARSPGNKKNPGPFE